jgi:hypothetical protein
MKTLEQLTATNDPGIRLVREWANACKHTCELLPPSESRARVLESVQVSTHSILGAILYETGGILIDHGWLRLLGSGHPKLTRTLPAWNEGRATGFLLVADDAVGGFFAINGGGLGDDLGKMYYFAPDSLRWEATELDHSQFMIGAMSDKIKGYYESMRWPGWTEDVENLHGDRCYSFYPPLWTKEGSINTSHRGDVPIHEHWGAQMDFLGQLNTPDAGT